MAQIGSGHDFGQATNIKQGLNKRTVPQLSTAYIFAQGILGQTWMLSPARACVAAHWREQVDNRRHSFFLVQGTALRTHTHRVFIAFWTGTCAYFHLFPFGEARSDGRFPALIGFWMCESIYLPLITAEHPLRKNAREFKRACQGSTLAWIRRTTTRLQPEGCAASGCALHFHTHSSRVDICQMLRC